jgi:formate-dependent nitrite reductase membrane component NrfD
MFLNVLKLFEYIDYSSLRNRIKALMYKCFQNQFNESYMIMFLDSKNILLISLLLLHLNYWLIIILNDLKSIKIKHKNQSYKLT